MSNHLIESDDRGEIIVKADEVDQTGTDISPVPDEQLLAQVADDFALKPSPAVAAVDRTSSVPASSGIWPLMRPGLARDAVAPPPPMQPPPPAPGQSAAELATDSLSLAQLRRIVQDIPKAEQQVYAFRYADCQAFPEELDEWFQYSEPERMMLMGSKVSFQQQWNEFTRENMRSDSLSWLDVDNDTRKTFIRLLLQGLNDSDLYTRIEALESICYVMCGVWGITGGKAAEDYPDNPTDQEESETPKSKSLQIQWIVENVVLVYECDGVQRLYEYMKSIFDKEKYPQEMTSVDVNNEQQHATYLIARERESNLILTCMYFVIEVARRQEALDRTNVKLRNAISELQPSLLLTLVKIISGLRWEDSAAIPFTRIALLFWKSILLLFGGSKDLENAKKELEPKMNLPEDPADRREPFLTASPLDYHIFRQEVISKYPAYNPPPPVVPLELDHNSILPPFGTNPSRLASTHGVSGPPTVGSSGSILHQPVHIATPAPSPPPSPIGPSGKAAKKQNYQTNQHFPFMYPPLDDSSNNIGGKGTSEMQDTLVGKKWEGSDVPASIIEAGKLFSSHVKMTRATQQLWEERERFIKYERGWNMDSTVGDDVACDENDADPSTMPPENRKDSRSSKPPETENEDIQRRLNEVEDFYRQALPHLQAVVIVLLKVILTNISAAINQANGQNGHVSGYSYSGGQEDFLNDIADLDMVRLREITAKALSGTLILLLKWFKRSHILKFEYMTQLLLDSNYLPLILKMFAHQDVDQLIAQQNDRKEYSFFHFCRFQSDDPPEDDSIENESMDDEEEAIPPPILRRRPSANGSSSVRGPSPVKQTEHGYPDAGGRPEVDELGYPIGPVPEDPITNYSFRNFFSIINYLHIMQKITRRKAHRCLLLVQYRSSTILRKALKIPDPHLRLYTLKLFKSQVPYCGRKWRQTNMRVITAIYLYCRPELRNDWLAGSDVDAEVEDALPQEQALRGLTHWWHLRRYKDVLNVTEDGTSIFEDERDFFTRELEAMGWGVYGEEMMNEVDERDLGLPTNGTTEWDGGPLQMEGW